MSKTTQETVNSNLINKDDLTEVAVIVNSLRYLSGDMLEGYFYCYNPMNDNNDLLRCGYGYNRYRAYMDLIDDGIFRIEEELKKYGITI